MVCLPEAFRLSPSSEVFYIKKWQKYKIYEYKIMPFSGIFTFIQSLCLFVCLFVCIEVLRPNQSNGVMSSAASLPNHTFIGQA